MKYVKLDKLRKPYITTYDYMNTISLHFRIGDYKNLQEHHPLLDKDHYIKSIIHIINISKKDNWHILYFCEDEDIDYVNDKIEIMRNEFINLSFTKIDSIYKDWEQLLIMSLCSHNIIANSSFSWWAAYFNTNNNIVCYPDIWFGPKQGNKDMSDMFPSSWSKIN